MRVIAPFVLMLALCSGAWAQSSSAPDTDSKSGSSDLATVRNELETVEDELLHLLVARAILPRCTYDEEAPVLTPLYAVISPEQSAGDGEKPSQKLPDYVNDPVESAQGQTVVQYLYEHVFGSLDEDSKPCSSHEGNGNGNVLVSLASMDCVAARVRLGLSVAAAKFAADSNKYCDLAEKGDAEGIRRALTNTTQEQLVLQRVYDKAAAWAVRPAKLPSPPTGGKAPMRPTSKDETTPSTPPAMPEVGTQRVNAFADAVRTLFKDFLVPLTTKVEVDFLLMTNCSG